ncbi:hypothetical protein JVU11DRAFT_1043 [Chiua virens]|nr:hypothetical protein JVU11DRAFT_1043 [Chiua virens]
MHDGEHPLLAELTSLRNTAARYQHEAHTVAITLQRHSLESSRLHEHAAALEQENARLAHEIQTLHAHPDTPPHPAVAQVQELSLALRRVSEKIALTENTLFQRTSELTEARSELSRARHAADGAFELVARMRAREEASKARERELELMARASDQERKMIDLVVQEYADLVRNLEGRKSLNSYPLLTLVDNLQDGKSTLHGMLTAFSTESEQLHATITELNAKVSNLQMALDAERLTASHDRTLHSQAKTDLDKLSLEDQTAAKMVARYMKFSQASTNALQEQIMSLKTRHASTISTLELQLSIAESQLASECSRTSRLQDALDELCEDLARESYGRRREISLRLALLSREEGIAELLRRWTHSAKELYARCYNSDPRASDIVQQTFHRVVSDAESLLSILDDDVQFTDATRTSASLARMVLSREAVDALRTELANEIQKRIEVVRKCAFDHPEGTPSPAHPESSPDHALLTPSRNARPEHDEPSDSASSFRVLPAAPSIGEKGEIRSISLPSVQDSISTSATLLVDEEPKVLPPISPVVSMLDLRQDLDPLRTEESLVAPIHTSTSSLLYHLMSYRIHLPHPIPLSTLLSELGNTRHRYDTFRRAFRDCSVALKELERTLASSSPSSNSQTKFRQYLETALARIDDYAEDARVELEIRVADEELTARGFETVLSVPASLVDTDERAEMEANARVFVDGTEEGVMRAMDTFGKKLEDVQNDVAEVKRAVHGLAMSDGAMGEGETIDGDEDTKGGAGWTAWTVGLLGTTSTQSRSATPVQTFGAVMTSPRLRHVSSLKSLHGDTGTQEPDNGPLSGLNLRIPMPMPSATYPHLGLGSATRLRTLSTMYAVRGLRSSSVVGFGVGLGGSPSPARARGVAERVEGGLVSSPLRAERGNHASNTQDAEMHDLGDVE